MTKLEAETITILTKLLQIYIGTGMISNHDFFPNGSDATLHRPFADQISIQTIFERFLGRIAVPSLRQ